jgi:hypothetical protein
MTESAAEREARHMAWLIEDDNGEMLFTEALHAYEEVGRGFCLSSESADRHRGLPEGQTRTAYFAAEHISKVPFSQEDRRIVEQMVLTYEPSVQCVVVIEEDGAAFAYKVRGMRQS